MDGPSGHAADGCNLHRCRAPIYQHPACLELPPVERRLAATDGCSHRWLQSQRFSKFSKFSNAYLPQKTFLYFIFLDTMEIGELGELGEPLGTKMGAEAPTVVVFFEFF